MGERAALELYSHIIIADSYAIEGKNNTYYFAPISKGKRSEC